MKVRTRKLISILCVLALVVGLVPMTVSAEFMPGEVAEIPLGDEGMTPALELTTDDGWAGLDEIGTQPEEPAQLLDANPDYIHNFTTDGTTTAGIYTGITGKSTSDSSYGLPMKYGDLNLTSALKMESSTSVKFNAPEAGTMILVFSTPGKKVKLDGTSNTIPSDGILRWSVTAGGHEVTKDTTNTALAYMEFQGSCPGHEYTDATKVKEIKAATCTEAGEQVRLCIHCGAENTATETIPALGHDFAGRYTQTKAPTCASDGVETATCSRCDAVDTKTIPATGAHEWEDGKCKNCGLTQGQTPCENHTMEEQTGTPATCTTPGEKVEKCSVCGMTITTPIAALGHDWTGEWVQTKDPTCTAVGEETLTCKRAGCGQTQKRDVAKLPHTDADGNGNCDDCGTKLGEPLKGAGGWLETMYVETDQFKVEDVAEVSWTGAMNGSMGPGNRFGYDMDYLVRTLNGKTRIDIPGVRAGDYTLSVTTAAGTTYTASVTVKAHDRSGYAHWNYTEGVGAYRDDGILKDEAIVLYVTEENKNTVALDAPDGTHVEGIGNILNSVGQESSENPGFCKRTSGTSVYWGIANDNQNVLKKLADRNIPLVVRIIGTVSSKHQDHQGSSGIHGLTDYDSFDYGGSPGDNGGMARMKACKNITIEGIGPDACMDGWGIHFMADSATSNYGKNFEVRNITFRNVPEDCIGMEGVQSGSTLTAPILHGWVHNCSFYAPSIPNPAESDKAGGDGACDFKRGEFFTMDYCYYEGYHKTNLVGSSDTSLQYNITWHHNRYKNCESRGPLGRQANMHIYNCIYEGQISYAMNPRANCYIVSEYNAFINCKNAMQIKQGAIKSYNDVFSGCIEALDGTIVDSMSTPVSSNNKYAGFELDSKLSYIPAMDYHLDRSIGTARQNVLAYTGAMKPADEIKSPEEIDTSTVKADRKPTAAVSLPYNKDINSTNAVVNGTKDNIVFNITKVDASMATFGKDEVGQNIVFMTDKYTDITMTPGGSSSISLIDSAGQTVVTDGTTATKCPPGIYYIQPTNQSKGVFKEGKLSHLKIEESTNAPAIHTHDYTTDGGVVTPATCSKEGIRKWVCSCGDFITKPIPVTDHVDANPGDGFCDVCGLEMSIITPDDPTKPKIPVTSVTVSPKALNLLQGETAELTATILPSDATNKAVAYSSSDTTVATVGTKGVVTAKGPGTCTITVKASDNKQDTMTVTVTGVTREQFTFNAVEQGAQPADSTPAANGMKVGDADYFTVKGTNAVWRTKNKDTDKTTASLQIGSQESSSLTFTVPANSQANVVISFASTGSSNTSAVALLNAAGERELSTDAASLGYVKGTSGGKVSYEGLPAGTYTIVAPKNVNPRDVGLEKWADPTNTSDPSNPNNRGARITTVNVIQITSSGEIDPKPITAINFAQTSLNLTVGDVYTLAYTLTPSDASRPILDWASSNTEVARVNKGIIRANAPGETIITAKSYSGVVASCRVNVKLDPSQMVHITKITIVGADKVATEGEITMAADVEPENATCKVVWSVDDPTIARIDENGQLWGLKDGIVTVTASAEHEGYDAKATKQVIVGEGAPLNTMNGESKDLGWRYVPPIGNASTGTLTITGMSAEDTVLAATYDAKGRMTGVVELTVSEATARISKSAARLKLFWVNTLEQPMCEAAIAK